MWEFFVGVSIACFFAVYVIRKKDTPAPRRREVVYAPADEIIRYKTRKKADDVSQESRYSFDSAPAPFREEPQIRTAEVEVRDEYTANAGVGTFNSAPIQNKPIATESAGIQGSRSSDDEERKRGEMLNPRLSDDEDEEKKQKFSALRFFDS